MERKERSHRLIVKGAKHEECTVCGYKRATVEIPAAGTTIAPATTPKKGSTITSTSAVNNPKTGDNSKIFITNDF